MSVMPMTSLGRMRAERTGCAKAWTPLEMLEDLLREARAGTIDLTSAIVVFPDGNGQNLIRRAGMNRDEELVLLRSVYERAAGLGEDYGT